MYEYSYFDYIASHVHIKREKKVHTKSKYTAVLLSINNETQRVPLLVLSSTFMTYTPSFIPGQLSLAKDH